MQQNYKILLTLKFKMVFGWVIAWEDEETIAEMSTSRYIGN